jgi:hypothetical protein
MEPRPSWWQQIKKHPVRAVLISLLAVVIVLIILSVLGYIFNWDWTGLGSYVSPPHSNESDFQRSKTLWDWLQLLIIPAVLVVAGYIINLTISRSEQEATKQRDTTEHEIALDNKREEALQAYIDKMSELLLHEKLRNSAEEDELRKIARVRTLTILRRLDAARNRTLLDFLFESDLIRRKADTDIIKLEGANLSKVELEGADLQEAKLERANLFNAQLHEAKLQGAKLQGADLWVANLTGANLINTNLINTNLSGAVRREVASVIVP